MSKPMKNINDLIKQYQSQQKLAEVLGTSQTQVSRWARNGAFINVKTGEVFVKSQVQVKPL